MKRNIYFIAENEDDIEVINARLNEIKAEADKHSKEFKLQIKPDAYEKEKWNKKVSSYSKKAINKPWKATKSILSFSLPSKETIAITLGAGGGYPWLPSFFLQR